MCSAGDYPLKEGYPDEYPAAMKIRFDEELPVWNYRAIPRKMRQLINSVS